MVFHFNAIHIVVGNVDQDRINPIGTMVIVSVVVLVHGLIMVRLVAIVYIALQVMVYVAEDAANVALVPILAVDTEQYVQVVPLDSM